MHIEFLKKYHKYCLSKGLTETQVQHLKEILTVLLNEDMKYFYPFRTGGMMVIKR